MLSEAMHSLLQTILRTENTPLVLAKVMSDVVDLLEAGWSVVLTHGNGPQVGELMAMDADVSHHG